MYNWLINYVNKDAEIAHFRNKKNNGYAALKSLSEAPAIVYYAQKEFKICEAQLAKLKWDTASDFNEYVTKFQTLAAKNGSYWPESA